MKNKSRQKHSLFSNYGFSIMELMVALGLSGIVSLGIMTSMKNIGQTKKGISQDFESFVQVYRLRNHLADETNCNTVLGGTSVSGGAPSSLPSFFQIGTEFTGMAGKIKISSVTLNNFISSTAAEDTGIADLTSTFVRIGKSYSKKDITHIFPVKVRVSGGNVVSCITDTTIYLKSLCQSLGGTYSGGVCPDITVNQLNLTGTLQSNTSAITPNSAFLNNEHVVNEQWVKDFFAGEGDMTESNRAAILKKLLAMTLADLDAMRDNILGKVSTSGTACTPIHNDSSNSTMMDNISYNYDSGTETAQISWTCATTGVRPFNDLMEALCRMKSKGATGYNISTGLCN